MILEDTQNSQAEHPIPIDQVGVSELRFPIYIEDRTKEKQQVAAIIEASVSLPRHFKGTHMSRFIEVLNEYQDRIFSMSSIPGILKDLKQRLDAERAYIKLDFPYFLKRSAPETGRESLMDYDCSFKGEVNGKSDDFVIGVEVPVSSLCPCSKAISEYGAHNQRGCISIEVRPERSESGERKAVWIEELIDIAEQSGSSPVYSLLKRPDERHVTMRMYENPMFVEDIVRNVARLLMADERIAWFRTRIVNFESIHNHNAFARIEWSRN